MNALAPHPALARRPADSGELCQLVTDWKGGLASDGAIVEPKMDGIRACWIDGELVSREGSPIRGTAHIAEIIRAIEHEAAVPLFLDGEFLVDASFDATLSHFASAGAAGDVGTMWIWEALPMRVWTGEDPCEALEVRRGKLDRLVKPFECDALRVMPWAYMTDVAEIEAHAADFIAQGGEGIVVKQGLATYRRARCGTWQRIKRRLTLDLEIVGYAAEKARPHMLGALIVDHAGTRVRIHAGFSEAERMAMWRDRADLVGGMAEIECMERTDAGSLRSPRFVRIRPEKRIGR